MRIRNPFFFAIVLLVATAQRLPAPIHEEATPTPKPRTIERPKPKVVATPKPKPTPPFSFAGTWSGSFQNICLDNNFTAQVTITVSPDQGTVTTEMLSARSVRPCNRTGDVLQWQDSGQSVSLKRNSNGTVTYLDARTVDGTPCSTTGVLARR